MKIIYLVSAVVLFFSTNCLADQEETTRNPSSEVEESKQREYLPGEEVTTKSGQKLKVWSTRGSVPVNKAPEPFKVDEQQNLNVIIDSRGRQDTKDQGR